MFYQARTKRLLAPLMIAGTLTGILAFSAPVQANDANKDKKNEKATMKREVKSDYLVTVGKITHRKSWIATRQPVREPAVSNVRSTGVFVRQGKATWWLPQSEVRQQTSSTATRSETNTKSGGRFVQQGKATVWVPNNK